MRLYLHIGMQKTGTSSLQYFFQSNKAVLAEDGILYPHVSEFDAIEFRGVSHHNCIAGTLGDFSTAFPRLSSKGIDTLRRFLGASKKPVLLSAEDFSRTLDLAKLKAALAGIETKVIVYLREQAAWAQSLYNERNKILFGRVDDSIFDSPIPTGDDLFLFMRQQRYAPLMHYAELVERWAAAFGKEHVIVRVFDKQALVGGDLVNDFMLTLGISDLGRYKRPPRVNQNLANAWIAVVREIDAAHGRQAAKTVVARLNTLASRQEITLAGPAEILPDETIVRLQSEHADDNSRLAREFLWRDQLFPDQRSG